MCQDFEPSKRCFHCDKKLPNVYKRIQRIIDEAKRGKESNGRICLRSLQDLMPFCSDFYTHGFGQELFNDVVKTYFLTGLQQPEQREELQPVPLSVSVSLPDVDLSRIKVPHPSPHVIRNHKTEEVLNQEFREHLEAAATSSDINKSSHHRGTMLYDSVGPGLSSITVKPDPDQIIITDDEEEADIVHNCRRSKMDMYKYPSPSHLPGLSYSEQAAALYAMREMVLPAPPLAFMPFPFSIKLDEEECHELEVESRLSHIRRMHNLNGSSRTQPRPAHANQLRLPLLIDVVRKLVRQKFLEIKQNHSKKQTPFEAQDHQERQEADLFSPFGPYLPAFTPALAAGSPDSEVMSSPLYKHIMESIYANMMREETPVPKPFGKVNESSRIGDTLKDIIARTIMEKMRFRDTSSDENSVPSSPDAHHRLSSSSSSRTGHGAFILNTTLPHMNKESKLLGECSPPKRAKKDSSSSKSRNSNGSKQELTDANGQPVKKTRPKRGQYRKYNSQLLMDAVKAVQRGEMSVHRAGSYFGVPHSTLEYKVKERHLLRQKKARETQSPSGATPKSGDPPPSTATTTTHGSQGGGDSSNGSTPVDSCNTTSKKPTIISSPPVRSLSCSSSSSSSSAPPATASTTSQSKKSSTAPPSVKLPAPSPRSISPYSSAITSSSSSALVPPVQQNKESSSLTWFPPYLGSPAPSHLESPVTFAPQSLSLNNSASELLRKLQHKVQTKESTYTRESAFDFPIGKEHHMFDLSQAESSMSVMPERLALYNQTV
ncbi:uncharacterized protein LOC106011067 [Aplysia californica]|uniref:Uncharacterized protein LOC106011067 n=1 Tax=Aplysia californica TaxID=6500 RepID=A0ABM0ZUQ1_APLCA|nr:uncharacterized protein LOC106011067 [Aplysia californica]XP_035824186.1 uncharacterized protein LOC106011067 [Aplysia californica]